MAAVEEAVQAAPGVGEGGGFDRRNTDWYIDKAFRGLYSWVAYRPSCSSSVSSSSSARRAWGLSSRPWI